MDRKTLIAILLIIVVFWLSNELIWKNKAVPESTPPLNTDSTSVEIKEIIEEPLVEEIPVVSSDAMFDSYGVDRIW